MSWALNSSIARKGTSVNADISRACSPEPGAVQLYGAGRRNSVQIATDNAGISIASPGLSRVDTSVSLASIPTHGVSRGRVALPMR